MAPLAAATSAEPLTTPVILLVFNRPGLTRQVLAAVRAARPAELLVVADGPRPDHPTDAARCAEVREVIRSGVDWPCRVRTEYADTNLGCGRRVFSGLQWAFGLVEEAIILEDDCLPQADFFRFAATMLARFRNDARVFQVSGTNFRDPVPPRSAEYLFSRHCSVWGWATWRRALAGYTLDLDWWRRPNAAADLRARCASGREYRLISSLLDSQLHGVVDTWDVQWLGHVFRHGGLSVVPGTNLVANLGADGNHTSRRSARHFRPVGALDFPLRNPSAAAADAAYDRALVEQHRPPGGWWLGPVANWAVRTRLGAWWRRRRRPATSPRSA